MLKSSLALLLFLFAAQIDAQEIINNDSIRFGNGTEQSINTTGNVQQPFYYNSTSALWRKLTYSTYPLDNAVAIGGDGTAEWNLNGTMVNNFVNTGQVIDNSGFVPTTGNNGYGVLVSTGTITVAGQTLELKNTYELGQTDNFVKITTKITNTSGTAVTNLRYWIGTRDDWVGATDGPREQRGNLVDGAFEMITNQADRAKALLITSGDEGVLFYTDSDKGNNIIQSCCSWSNVTSQNPATAAIDVTGDGSYGFYVRMNDLANGESDEFSWYYAAGELSALDDVIADVANASGAVSNITCDAADYTAQVNADATGYYIVVADGSTAPTEAQIKAGVDYSGVTVIDQGSAAMLADVDHVFNITGLTVETAYDLYFVGEDAVPQFTAILSSSFTTDDTTDPDTPTLADVTGECTATISGPAPTTTDNCAGTVTGTTSDALTYSTQGTHVVVWNFDDGNGNSIDVNQNVIISDATAPVADMANLPDITDECSVAAPTAPTATDNCEGAITGTTATVFPITAQGTTVVTWTYDDGNGNTSTQDQNVIIADVTAPVADMATLADITDECEVTALMDPTATDNCGGMVTVTNDATLPINTQGTTVVTWTYTDTEGNASTQAQNVIITDVTAPVADMATLADITDECEVTALMDPTATDNCGGMVTVTNDATLPINTQGTTVVTWTYTDAVGNASTQAQNVIITDATAPVADMATLADVTAECEVTSLTDPTATDNCGGMVTVTNDATLPINTSGTTVVTWTYTDAAGNASTQAQNVIIADMTAPVADMANLPDVSAECEVAMLTDPTATDNCAGMVTVTNDATLPITALGTTVVTWTYTDVAGNASTQAQNVVVLTDATAPVADMATLADVTAECEVAALMDPTATDNCGGMVTVTNDATLPINTQGTTVVTWTYTDSEGNMSTQAQNVVIADMTAPVADMATLADVTSLCEVTSLTDPTATDNCGGMVTVTNDATLPISTPGTTVVTWTYTDSEGNMSTQAQNVVVDGAAPVITTQPMSQTESEGTDVTFTVEATGADLTYQWRFNGINLYNYPGVMEGVFTNTLDLYSVTPISYGDYDCVITGSCGSITTDIATLIVPNTTSIEGVDGSETLIYPNPTSSLITVEFSSIVMNSEIQLIDITGRVLRSINTVDAITTFDISEYSNGVYYIRVIKDNNLETFKVVKQ